MADLIPQLRSTLPAVLQDAGEEASERVIEFFTAEIRNENTREAYALAVRRFFRWVDQHGLNLSDIEPVHVAAYVEGDDRAPATVKQNLAALRRLFDFLVTGQVLFQPCRAGALPEAKRQWRHNARPHRRGGPRATGLDRRGEKRVAAAPGPRHHRRHDVHLRPRLGGLPIGRRRLLPGGPPMEDSPS